MHTTLILATLLAVPGCCFAESSCSGPQGSNALRQSLSLQREAIRVDPFSIRTLAYTSCARLESVSTPSRPQAATLTGRPSREASSEPASAAAASASALMIRGGTRVRVLQIEQMLRIETTGIAQGSGHLGDRVWVRVLVPGSDGLGRLALGIVRSADCLEIVE